MSQQTPLDVDRIEAARADARIGGKVVVFQSTASTNDIAWAYASNADNQGLCVLAESQAKGRGRRGRTWLSEPGQSILCSILLTRTAIEAELLTLAAAVATAEAINGSAWAAPALQGRIKWPNDILIQGRKVAGILVEKRTVKTNPCFVIGIGINCSQSRDMLDQYKLNLPATSLAIETGRPIDRTALVCDLLAQLEHWLDSVSGVSVRPTDHQASIDNRQSTIVNRWLELSGMLGAHVTVECDGRQYRGFCRGVDPARGLILQLDNSLVRMFSAAHTSMVQA